MSNSAVAFRFLIDPDDASFANPESMIDAIASFCAKTGQESPKADAELIRCIFDSLALKYRYVLESLQKMSPFKIEVLHVIGGGSQNKLLNQATANSIGIPVVAGPAEATAIGNVMMQAKGIGLVDSLHEMRELIINAISTEMFEPQDTEQWEKGYQKIQEQYINLNKNNHEQKRISSNIIRHSQRTLCGTWRRCRKHT